MVGDFDSLALEKIVKSRLKSIDKAPLWPLPPFVPHLSLLPFLVELDNPFLHFCKARAREGQRVTTKIEMENLKMSSQHEFGLTLPSEK